jgi:parallel beta-helix repeat protein
MKKTHLIIAGLLVVALVSCNNLGKTGSSLVTITVGSDKTASLSIQQATLYARLKNFLAAHLQMPSAMASIPSNVASIQITVWASDMPLITQTIDTMGLASASVTLVIPNGSNRLFALTGFDSSGTSITYAGGMSADLNGAEVSLPVPMINLGLVSNILYVSTSGDDATGDGTLQKPYRTITKALTIFPNGSVGILVWPGTYDGVTGGETFPLQLQTASALAGLGQSQTVVLQSGSTGINGAAGAYIDSLRLFICDNTGIDDRGLITHINNVLLDTDLSSCGGGAGDGIVLAADSTVSNTTIRDPFTSGITINSGNPIIKNTTLTQTVFWSANGIVVTTGNPTITNSTINGFFADGAGYAISLGTGTATVSQCSMSGNGNGISVSGGSPTISGNTISNNSNDGIFLTLSLAGAPPTATISGNTIGQNGYGIYGNAVGTSLIHNNKIFCSSFVDFYLVDSTANGFDISGNAWDHDITTTLVSGPTITNNFSGCPFGEDICYAYLLTTAPTYTPFNTAVPGGCQ